MFDSVYEEVLTYELQKCSVACERQVEVPVEYETIRMEAGVRADIIVENKVILEIKSVEKINNIYKKQLLTYLKLSNLKLVCF